MDIHLAYIKYHILVFQQKIFYCIYNTEIAQIFNEINVVYANDCPTVLTVEENQYLDGHHDLYAPSA